MGKKKIFTSVLVVAAVSLLIVLAFRVKIGATADSVAVLRTSGMTCGSCAEKITGTLQKLQGVAVTEVDVAGGWVIVGYDTKRLRPEAIAEKVKKAGYGSDIYTVLTPEKFREITGRKLGQNAAPSSGCCGAGGCRAKNPS